MKKFIAFILCLTLISTSFVFIAFADNEIVLKEYDFEELAAGESNGSSIITIGGGQGVSHDHRIVVTGTNPDGTSGNQLKITLGHKAHKHKFKNMFDSERFGVDGIYTLSAYVKLADESPTDSNIMMFELFKEGSTNGFANTADTPATITKDEWTLMEYEYHYEPEGDVIINFCIRLNEDVVEGYEPVILMDNVKVTEKSPSSVLADNPDYTYSQIAMYTFDGVSTTSSLKNRLHGADSYCTTGVVTSEYNYSTNTNSDRSAHLTGFVADSSKKLRIRDYTNYDYGICSPTLIEEGKTYRYSAMVRLADTNATDTDVIGFSAYNGAKTNADAGVDNINTARNNLGTTPIEFTINKYGWTKVWCEYTAGATNKPVSMGFVNPSSDTLDFICDHFVIEEMVPNPIWTSFTFEEEGEVDAISSAGDYTASVTFNETFTEDSASVIFAKYLNGALADVKVVNSADLENANTHTFTVLEEEKNQALITIFVWNSAAGMSNLVDRISIE